MNLNTNRSIAKFILLGFVTCGIYDLVMIHQATRDINIVCEGDEQKTHGLFMLILLSFVTCGIYGYCFAYKMGKRLQENAPRYGFELEEGGSSVVLWLIFGPLLCGFGQLFGFNILIKNLNSLCEAYNAYVEQYYAENPVEY